MTTKYFCDVCKEEKPLEEFYKHTDKHNAITASSVIYRAYTRTYTSPTPNESLSIKKDEPLRLEGDKFRATVHIQSKENEVNDICKSCAFKILSNLMKEQVIDRL